MSEGGKIIRIIGGKSVHIAEKISLWSTEGAIEFYSPKNVRIQGLENGVFYGKYQSPNLNVIPNSEYKIESNYAHDQLKELADELGEITFMLFMTQIFGYEIEAVALSRLYRYLCDNKLETPEIIVSKIKVGKRNGLAGYSNKRKKIIIYQGFLEEAIQDNDKRAELMSALVEEYGHHIDNLLRTELADEGIPDTDVIDDGAKFAYHLFKFDIFNKSSLNFAKTETPQYKGELVIDFQELHNDVLSYVDDDRHYSEDPTDDISNYGAGRNRKHNKNAAFAHGDIEFEALANPQARVFSNEEVLKIYYGNWLRDFSQVIVGLTVRGVNTAANLQKKQVVNKVSPMKLSHDGWVKLIKILAVKEFVYEPLKETKKNVSDNYLELEKTFEKEFGLLDKNILGIYRPEEHIDNPKGLLDESKVQDDKGNRVSFSDNGKVKYLYAGDNKISWAIDSKRNMSNFFWTDYPERESSVSYMKGKIIQAVQKKNNGKKAEGLRELGAALHVLEDFFAHTNFVEIYLRKLGVDAYPWVSTYKGKSHQQIPIVSGTFLGLDTMASIGPKLSELLFDPSLKVYKRREVNVLTFSEKLIQSVLEDLAKGQKTDTGSSYMGVEYSSWLAWFNSYLKFQNYLAKKYKDADSKEWMSKDFLDKLTSTAAENFQKGMNYTGQIMSFFPTLVFNIIFNSLDEVVHNAQTLTTTDYGNCPSHSQLAKDSYEHPLNRLSSELAKIAVKDVGTKYKNGMSGQALADYTANTYFVHPSNCKITEFESTIKDWTKKNPSIVSKLKFNTTYDHAEHEVRNLNKKSVDQIKSIIEYFEKITK
jgi:hypothetical protein